MYIGNQYLLYYGRSTSTQQYYNPRQQKTSPSFYILHRCADDMPVVQYAHIYSVRKYATHI